MSLMIETFATVFLFHLNMFCPNLISCFVLVHFKLHQFTLRIFTLYLNVETLMYYISIYIFEKWTLFKCLIRIIYFFRIKKWKTNHMKRVTGENYCYSNFWTNVYGADHTSIWTIRVWSDHMSIILDWLLTGQTIWIFGAWRYF